IVGGKYEIKYTTTGHITDESGWDAAEYSIILNTNTSPGNLETYNVTGLLFNLTYYFAVKTADEVPNWSSLSSTASAMAADLTAPGAPSLLTALNVDPDQGGEIYIEWTVSSDDGSGQNDVNGYRIYRATYSDDTSYDLMNTLSPGTTYYFDSTVSCGTTYYYKVAAYDNSYETASEIKSAYSIDELAPAAPINVIASNPGDGASLEVSWTANTEADLNGYYLYRSSESATEDFIKINGLIANDTDYYRDTYSLEVETSYWYKIQSVDTNSNISDFSQADKSVCIVNDSPDAFGLLQPLADATTAWLKIGFDWQTATDPNSGAGDYVRYELWYSSYSNFAAKQFETDITTSMFTLAGDIQDNTTWWWKVMAYDLYDGIRWSDTTRLFWTNVINDTPTVFGLSVPSDG
ncbi:MAG: hypothetical protein CVU80_02835, partial [Elusimicrobia bacterium HGW-Elusimicrobia-4]